MPIVFSRRLRISVLILLVIGFMSACSTLPGNFETPKISIAGITPKDVTLFEQRFEVQLRIQNPNNFDLGLNGIRFDIELNDKEFGNGMSPAKVIVPRLESEVVTGEVITGLDSFLRQVQGMNSTAAKLRYHLQGTAFAESPGNFTIPFDDSREVDLHFAPAAQE
ncbi:LEA type 2 family protein [Nitrospira sp. MA-1]|nr:LEA type 2 family protein [Nitrospira sp. MA-1]